MSTRIIQAKSLLSPPGDTIQEHLDFIGMSQAELAERMGRPKEKINDIINGRESITMATAFQLEKVLGIDSAFWLNRETNYRRQLFKIKEQEEFEKKRNWLNALPITAMRKLGWLPDTRDEHLLMDSLLKYFSVASTVDWARIYINKHASVSFKATLAKTESPHVLSAWLRQGELQAQEVRLAPFNKRKFRATLDNIKRLVSSAPGNPARHLQKLLALCGVAVVFTQSLPKSSIKGATRWFHNKPIIQLSGTYSNSGGFWFTFLYHAAYLLLNGKKDVFLDEIKGISTDQMKERQACAFAARLFFTEKELLQVIHNGPLTRKRIDAAIQKRKPILDRVVSRIMPSVVQGETKRIQKLNQKKK